MHQDTGKIPGSGGPDMPTYKSIARIFEKQRHIVVTKKVKSLVDGLLV
jgi:hypothetical protein